MTRARRRAPRTTFRGAKGANTKDIRDMEDMEAIGIFTERRKVTRSRWLNGSMEMAQPEGFVRDGSKLSQCLWLLYSTRGWALGQAGEKR